MEAGHAGPALSSPLDSRLGRITISSDAIAHIVGETARECYGVVGMASRGPVGKLLGKRERLKQGIQIARDPEGGVTIDLHVVVEYGLNLAEVASTIRNRVSYEAGRLTGLPVRSVEVHIDDVRRSP
ncbi:MAG TPA: Asp23/Gls24 family envelope stress response protein [Gaiellaceae bacterium]|nr:Asp23/Gls24 family envelope stress response protein [Gaiellaceae bacterium]